MEVFSTLALYFMKCQNHSGIRADVAQPVEQRFRNFLCTVTANSGKSLGIGAVTSGRHRIRHTEPLRDTMKRHIAGAEPSLEHSPGQRVPLY